MELHDLAAEWATDQMIKLFRGAHLLRRPSRRRSFLRFSRALVGPPRSLSEYLLVLSHGRWISLGFGLFGLGPTLCAHYPPQSTPTLQERRQIFKRLWVKHISCHSADTFSRPRNRNLRIPRADLIMPNTGSTMCLRAA
jgi:hypothetical protein